MPRHPDEAGRLAALSRLAVLDAVGEERLQRLVALAATVIDVPIVLVSIVEENRQWFRARVGLDVSETPRSASFCAHAILDDDGELFVIEDALQDERFADNPLVTGQPNIRFYAGRVIHDPTGYPVGTVCAIDRVPRILEPAQSAALDSIGWLVEQELARCDEIALAARITAAEAQKTLILNTLTEGVVLQGPDGAIVEWNPAAERVLGLSGDELAGRTSTDPRWQALHADGTPWPGETHPAMESLRTGRPVADAIMGICHPDGQRYWMRVNSQPVLDSSGNAHHVLTAFADVTVEVQEGARRAELEGALLRSEKAARVSLDALEQGVVLADASGVIHRMNPAARLILGYDASELSTLWGGPDWATYDESGRLLPENERPIQIAMTSGETVRGRVVGWRHRAGHRVLLRLSCVPAVDGSDRFLVAFTDITKDHLAQRILDVTFETAPVGLALIDHDRTILRCNDTFSVQAGRPKLDLVGLDVVSLLHGSDQPAAAAIGRDIGIAHDTAEVEQRVIRPDGSEIWVKTHLAVIGDLQHPMAIAASFDVTSERRLLQELSRFGHLFRHANDIIIVVDAHGDVLYASPSSERLLGYPDGYRDKSGILGFVHPDDLADARPHFLSLVHGERKAGPLTVRVHDSDGAVRYLECVAANLLDEADVGGIVITARDITERELLARQLLHQACHDTLTGLGNRKLLDENLSAALARAHRSCARVGICFIDLDGFKQINDDRGHAAGDDLLADVGQCILDNIRTGDTAARVGGDEFVVLVEPVVEPAQFIDVAQRIRDAIAGIDERVGASIGLAISTPTDTPSTLLQRADAAMYRAKAFHDSHIDANDLFTGTEAKADTR